MNRSTNQPSNPSASATFCATIVEEWSRNGVETAFVAPGSRSTPLVVELLNHPGIEVHLFHDERSASFAALGNAVATSKAAVVVCTSGTAAAHFHAAVLEASAASVPLLVCTADRPIELMGVAAPQTIDQTKLFGNAVRRFAEPEPAQLDQSHWWRSWASQLVADANGWAGKPGPVHINFRFREPLLGEAGPLPKGRLENKPWHTASTVETNITSDELALLAGLVCSSKGVILCGRGTPNPAAVAELGNLLSWPVLADHRSGVRLPHDTISHSDLLLRSPTFAARHTPELVLRLGEIQTSKTLSQWLERTQPTSISAVVDHRWTDPERIADFVVAAPNLAEDLVAEIGAAHRPSSEMLAFKQSWAAADEVANRTIEQTLTNATELTEPAIARQLLQHVPADSTLVLSSSMPVRDVEWFGQPRPDITVLSNRGTNGIDGVISTAVGVALTQTPTTLLIGDVAFLHDSSALAALATRSIDLHIVVVNNDGGGIFSFLPQAKQLSPSAFETLFGTPHGTDLETLCAAHNIPSSRWDHKNRLPTNQASTGVRVTVAATDRSSNKAIHDEIVHNVINALA